MKKIVGLAFAMALSNASFAAPLDKVIVEVIGPAQDGVIRSFDATSLTVLDVQRKIGKLGRAQSVSIQCKGNRMGGVGGTGGYSAFDLISGDHPGEINRDLRRLGVGHTTKLTEVCWLNQKDFERKRR
jgi:hypothetical protein